MWALINKQFSFGSYRTLPFWFIGTKINELVDIFGLAVVIWTIDNGITVWFVGEYTACAHGFSFHILQAYPRNSMSLGRLEPWTVPHSTKPELPSCCLFLFASNISQAMVPCRDAPQVDGSNCSQLCLLWTTQDVVFFTFFWVFLAVWWNVCL